ncbi:hypothetical protein ACQ5SO_04595 [Rhodovulum sp. DZ06]|uniref:hypothetical protein n=1 Tax=Rhodovulum sp. DZ06 TaxID=3425126 RepID=UPI003D32853B
MLAVNALASTMSNQGYGSATKRSQAYAARARIPALAAQQLLERGARADMSSASTALREQRLELLLRRAFVMIRALARLQTDDDAAGAQFALAERFAISTAGNWAYRFSWRQAGSGWSTRQELSGGGGGDALSLSLRGTLGGDLTVGGGAGNDALALNADLLRAATGGAGNDSLSFAGGVLGLISGGAGRDALSISAAAVGRASGGSGSDAIAFAGQVAGIIDGGSGNDALAVAAEAVGAVDGGAGRDAISVSVTSVGLVSGGAGSDAISVNAVDAWRIDGGAGDDAVSVVAGRLGELDAGAGDDAITVAAGAAGVISAGAGRDALTLIGGSFGSIDTGAGDDTILLSARDAAVELRKGGGADRLTVTSVGSLALRVEEDLAASVEDIQITREDDRIRLDFGGGDSLTIDGVSQAGAIFLNIGGEVYALSEGRAAAGLDVLA